MTTPATTPDCSLGRTIQQDLAHPDLTPGRHLLDSGYVAAELLATTQTQHRIAVLGPPFGA
jgi:transposase